jgi:hypothetical protein
MERFFQALRWLNLDVGVRSPHGFCQQERIRLLVGLKDEHFHAPDTAPGLFDCVNGKARWGLQRNGLAADRGV